MSDAVRGLLEEAAGGERAALAKLLSLVERGGDAARDVAAAAWARSGHAHTVGLTGAPGAGKSTLTSRLVGELRRSGERVAVLAIDPSSPFTGGAILGDRVRMGDHDLDPGVFIRSMATRGHLGGLALAAPEAVRVLDAAGFGWVLLETVGVGQVEVAVAGTADTTVVVLNPGWGDAVQAAKAGLIEIADIYVINKADRPGVEAARRDLERVLALSPPAGGWVPPIVAAVASSGQGVADVLAAVTAHRAWLDADGGGRRRDRRAARAEAELDGAVTALLRARLEARTDPATRARLRDEVAAGRLDPWSAAAALVEPDR